MEIKSTSYMILGHVAPLDLLELVPTTHLSAILFCQLLSEKYYLNRMPQRLIIISLRSVVVKVRIFTHDIILILARLLHTSNMREMIQTPVHFPWNSEKYQVSDLYV